MIFRTEEKIRAKSGVRLSPIASKSRRPHYRAWRKRFPPGSRQDSYRVGKISSGVPVSSRISLQKYIVSGVMMAEMMTMR